jgi:hypothetical protein
MSGPLRQCLSSYATAPEAPGSLQRLLASSRPFCPAVTAAWRARTTGIASTLSGIRQWHASQPAPAPSPSAPYNPAVQQTPSADMLQAELHDHRKFFGIMSLFRRRGHLIADLDPLKRGTRGPWKSPPPPPSFSDHDDAYDAYARGCFAASTCASHAARKPAHPSPLSPGAVAIRTDVTQSQLIRARSP